MDGTRARGRAWVLAVALYAAVLSGCPRGVDPAAGQGTACDADAVCNALEDGAVRRCGRLRVCVRGICEADAGSRLVACEE